MTSKQKKHQDSILNLYPHFLYHNQRAVAPDFIDLIKTGIAVFNPTTCKSAGFEYCKKFLKTFRRKGLFVACDEYIKNNTYACMQHKKIYHGKSTPIDYNSTICIMIRILGNALFEHIGIDNLNKYLPFSGFRIVFTRRFIGVIFTGMVQIKTINDKQQQVLYSFNRSASVNISNKSYEVWFTSHSISRLVERYSSDKKLTYEKYNYLYFALNHMVVKSSMNKSGTHIVDVFLPCTIGVLSSMSNEYSAKEKELADSFIEEFFEEGKTTYQKFFSFPVICDGNRLILKTSLVPGFFGTPENELVKRLPLDSEAYKFFNSDFDMQGVLSFEYQKIQILFQSKGYMQFFKDDLIQTDLGKAMSHVSIYDAPETDFDFSGRL
jgi:hypothetical protein